MTARNTSFVFKRMQVFFSQEMTAFNAEGGMVLTTRQESEVAIEPCKRLMWFT